MVFSPHIIGFAQSLDHDAIQAAWGEAKRVLAQIDAEPVEPGQPHHDDERDALLISYQQGLKHGKKLSHREGWEQAKEAAAKKADCSCEITCAKPSDCRGKIVAAIRETAND